MTKALREAGVIQGWRDELYPVTCAFHAPPLALIERAAAPHFGIKVRPSAAALRCRCAAGWRRHCAVRHWL